MAKVNAPVLSFNHGIVSKLALARVDLQRMRFAAEQQTNWMPKSVGPMSLRPGLKYIGATLNGHAFRAQPIPFVFSTEDTAIVELAAGQMRVRVDGEIITRPSVSTAITNGDFSAAAGWTLSMSGGATASMGDGFLHLAAIPLGSRSYATQAVTIAAPDQNVEHGLHMWVPLGPIKFRVGSTSGADDLIPTTDLDGGEHSLAFTPTTGTVYIQFETRLRREVRVDYCVIEAAGPMSIAHPWTQEGDDDLPLIRWTQSADILYLVCDGRYQARKIERRAPRSWSLVVFDTEDGPFKAAATDIVYLTPSRTYGDITLTSDIPFFTTEMPSSLLRLTHTNQEQTISIGAADQWTEPMRIAGITGTASVGGFTIDDIFAAELGITIPGRAAAGGSRTFYITVSGTYTGTLRLQRSFDGPDIGYRDVEVLAAGSISRTDEFDNSIVWYRIGFKPGEYSGGVVTISINYPGGGFSGVVRLITAPSSTTSIGAQVLGSLSSTAATKDWQEGMWSDKYGWPSATTIFEGRLWFFGNDRIWASVSDAYQSFDLQMEGDAAAISRSIGYGPVEIINWGLPLARLMLGTSGSEVSVRSSAFDEPITPTNFGLKDTSTQGSAKVGAVKVDQRGIFVQKTKRKLYQLLYSVETQDYATNDLTALLPDLAVDLTFVVAQRQPDTRLHIGTSDGSVMVLLFEPSEEVVCWYTVETDGFIEAAVVLPGTPEDEVYYYVRRTVNGQTVRCVEKFAVEEDCQGLPQAHLADAHVIYSGAATTTITGLSHLEGRNVVAWTWGTAADSGTDFAALGQVTPVYRVTGGQITLPLAVTNACVGLPYTAAFRSAKLAYGAQLGSALSQKKRLDHVGLILHNTHAQGLQAGQYEERLDPLPQMYKGAAVNPQRVYTDFDEPMIPIPGRWDTDARLFIQAQAPRPATVLGAIIGLTTHEKS